MWQYVKEAYLLRQALSLCSALASYEERLEAAFFEACRVLILRLMSQGGKHKLSLTEVNERINELLKQAVKSDGVINLFSDIKEEFSIRITLSSQTSRGACFPIGQSMIASSGSSKRWVVLNCVFMICAINTLLSPSRTGTI